MKAEDNPLLNLERVQAQRLFRKEVKPQANGGRNGFDPKYLIQGFDIVCSAWKHAAELKARYLKLRLNMNTRIDKAYMQSQEIELIGMYVNKDFTEEQVMGYYEKNERYFTHTIIRNNMKSLVNELANKIYLSKEGR